MGSRPERPPSTIRLTWDDGRDGRKPTWRYHLTWGTEAKPEHEEDGALAASAKLGVHAAADDLHGLLRAQLEDELDDAAYDCEVSQGHQRRLWRLRPGPRPRHGVSTKPRAIRATDEQIANWSAAAGDEPWSTWAAAALDRAAARAKRD